MSRFALEGFARYTERCVCSLSEPLQQSLQRMQIKKVAEACASVARRMMEINQKDWRTWCTWQSCREYHHSSRA